jgi:hypothetical protein
MFSALMAEFLGSMLPTSRSFSWFPVRSCLHLSQAIFPCFLALHLYTTFGMASGFAQGVCEAGGVGVGFSVRCCTLISARANGFGR